MDDLERRYLETEDFVLRRWFKDVFRKIGEEDIKDTRRQPQKDELFLQKEQDWLKFGYSKEYLDSMKEMEFWDNEYNKIFHYDELIQKMREE